MFNKKLVERDVQDRLVNQYQAAGVHVLEELSFEITKITFNEISDLLEQHLPSVSATKLGTFFELIFENGNKYNISNKNRRLDILVVEDDDNLIIELKCDAKYTQQKFKGEYELKIQVMSYIIGFMYVNNKLPNKLMLLFVGLPHKKKYHDLEQIKDILCSIRNDIHDELGNAVETEICAFDIDSIDDVTIDKLISETN
jgi:hypothetical protein